MSYRGFGATSQLLSTLPVDVTPVFTPPAPPLSDSVPGTLLAVVLSIAPAMVVGSLAGAHLATYDDKQREWGMYGAFLGGGVAAFALLMDYMRPR